MKLKALALPLLLVLALAVPNKGAGNSATFRTLVQATSAWDGTAYQHYPAGQPQLSVLKIMIPAHTVLKWHTHPMPNAAYVLSGNLTVEKPDGTRHHFVAGDAFAEVTGVVHRGFAGDKPVVLIVFYAGAKGLPPSEAAPAAPSVETPR